MRNLYSLLIGALSLLASASAHAQAIYNCDANQESIIRSAIDRSIQLIEAPHSEYAWVRFFGDDAAIRESAQAILKDIHDALLVLGAAAEHVDGMTARNLSYSCTSLGCEGPNIAWVSKGGTQVNICSKFFSARESVHWSIDEGTRVRALVHEAFHSVTGIADNIPYIVDACASGGCTALDSMDLAKYAPYYALQNPNAYGYFIQDGL